MTPRRIIPALFLAAWLAAPASAGPEEMAAVVNEENPEALPVLTQVEKPFVFIYGTWMNQAKVENGTASLHCKSSKGAAGLNENMSALPEQRLVMRVVVGKNNKAKILRLILRDEDANTAVWDYDLSTVPKEEPVLIRPIDNVSLARPHIIDKKDGKPGEAPNLAKLRQWKLSGDWTEDALEVDVSVILLE